MKFTFNIILWTIGISLLTFEICSAILDTMFSYTPVFATVVLFTGFILGVAIAMRE